MSKEKLPEIVTPTAEAIAIMRELFVSFVEGGFTEDQALTLIAKIILSSPTEDE